MVGVILFRSSHAHQLAAPRNTSWNRLRTINFAQPDSLEFHARLAMTRSSRSNVSSMSRRVCAVETYRRPSGTM